MTRYKDIVRHYEECFAKYGDNHRGVDWPNEHDAHTRYKTMLDLVPNGNEKVTLLDFGCGAGHLLEYIKNHGLIRLDYVGLDLSAKFVAYCSQKYPEQQFFCVDATQDPASIPQCDYAVLNGVFTERCTLPFDDMWAFFTTLLKAVFLRTRCGVAFNVMSKHVDWERDDLFHVPFDMLAAYLTSSLSRDFIFRNDYGLFEYTTYVYKSKDKRCLT